MPAKAKRRTRCKPTAPKDPEECPICGQEFTKGLARHETICNTYVTGRKKLVEMAQQQKKKREHVHSIFGRPDDFMDVDTGHMNMDIDEYAPDAPATVPLPPRFIYVKHHPHAEKFPEFIPLDCGVLNPHFADYKFASKCVRRRMPNAQIDEDLHEMHGHIYSSDCHVSFKTHRDLKQSLAAARVSNIAFHSETLIIDFDGRHFRGPFEVDIEFRDPWRIMKDWVCDPMLAPVSTWFSQEKFLCSRGTIEYSNPLYDEPWTGTWREVDARNTNLEYCNVVDCVDEDMYLRIIG
ncbi:hypothetical protein FB451DRAFT_1396679 [Mycena latifolia]|nr:hypothetical protein FB451DRAFT_1396679 [Mycena latifolia]